MRNFDMIPYIVVFLIILLIMTILAFAPPKAAGGEIDSAVAMYSKKYGVDASLVRAIIQIESSGNPNAVGRLGEIGLMQLRPEMHSCASFEIERNIRCGVRYLAYIKDRHKARHPTAWFVYYNVGPYNKRVTEPKNVQYYQQVRQAMGPIDF